MGIEPTTFCAANATLYHGATGTLFVILADRSRWTRTAFGLAFAPAIDVSQESKDSAIALNYWIFELDYIGPIGCPGSLQAVFQLLWWVLLELIGIPEGCVFSHPHRPTSQKVPSVHFSRQNFSVLRRPSVWTFPLSQGVHTCNSGGVGATSMGRHADSSVPGRLAVVRQIITTGCQQHTAFVVSYSHIGSKGELSE